MAKVFNQQMNIAKAIGIFAIVASHVNWDIFGGFISEYSFHVPLFFFIAGYFFKNEIFDGNNKIKSYFIFIKNTIFKYLSRFYAYHLFYGFITWLVFISCNRLYGELPALKNLTISPIAYTPFGFSIPNWFLYQLTISLIFFALVMTISHKLKVAPPPKNCYLSF